MREAVREQVEAFFASLADALGGRNAQTEAILAEVRADLEAQAHTSMRAGADPDRAWTDALDSLGNPYELGHRMRQEVPPPPPGPALRALRYGLAGVVIAWVTMTRDGPQIGNIALKGLFDRKGLDPEMFGAYDRKGWDDSGDH